MMPRSTDTLIMSPVLRTILLVLYVAVLPGILGQKFTFDTGITFSKSGGISPQANWSAHGTVVLTPGDLVGFDQRVIINALQEVCTVDLTNCPSAQLPTSHRSCYCRSETNGQYEIHVGGQATLSQSGMTIQAVVPGRGALRNIFGAATIGNLPNMTDKKSRLNATFTMDDGVPQTLLDTQTVRVCPGEWFILQICVDNGHPKADLTIKVDRTIKIIDGRCTKVIHQFSPGQDRTLTFEYKEPEGCSQRNYIYFRDDVNACPHTTARTSQPLKSMTTALPATTTTTTSTSTTTAPRQISGICPGTPRSVTKLPSGDEVLVDEVSFNKTWVVFQRRVSADVDFNRSWDDYVAGFGVVSDSYWLGLNQIHDMCNKETKCQLLVHLKYAGEPNKVTKQPDGCYHARYAEFWLDGADRNYRLNVNAYSGTAGDGLENSGAQPADQMEFSTFDRDHDDYHFRNCASIFSSGWWFRKCMDANLNADLKGRHAMWHPLTGVNSVVTFTELKMRRLE